MRKIPFIKSDPVTDTLKEVRSHIDVSKAVYVYRNLHKRCFSVKQGGLVRCHTEYMCMKDVKFVVSESGRQRVITEKVKNVHAFVKGMVAETTKDQPFYEDRSYNHCSYNPYRGPSFFINDDPKQEIDETEWLDMAVGESPELLSHPGS